MVTEAVRRREVGATMFVHPSPATEVSMLVVFVGSGVLVTRVVDYGQFAPAAVLGSTVALTVATEVVHESLHLAVLRRSGHAATIRWRDLAVVPAGGAVPRRDLFVAVVTPVVVISAPAATVVLLATAPVLVAAAGYVLVVNATLSVLDVATAATLARLPAGTVVDFDGSDGDADELDDGGVDGAGAGRL